MIHPVGLDSPCCQGGGSSWTANLENETHHPEIPSLVHGRVFASSASSSHLSGVNHALHSRLPRAGTGTEKGFPSNAGAEARHSNRARSFPKPCRPGAREICSSIIHPKHSEEDREGVLYTASTTEREISTIAIDELRRRRKTSIA